MQEPDDRLAGDLVWELFPEQSRPRTLLLVAVPFLVIETWFLDPALSVVLACLAVSWGDFDRGRKLRRTIPDQVGASICALFTHAWGAEKIGVAAVAIMYVTFLMAALRGKLDPCPREIPTAMILAVGGFVASSILTAYGLFKAFRSGMRVWVGEGINQARTLLLGMLIVAFTLSVLMPLCLLLIGWPPGAAHQKTGILIPVIFSIGLFGSLFVAPAILLVILDWMSKRVVADRPGKFGSKIPTVGKWNH